MSVTYTTLAENSIENYPFWDQYNEAVEFLNNQENFRPFDKGLTDLIIKAGYDGPKEDAKSKADFLTMKLKQIGSKIDSDTVLAWFTGKHRPKIEPASRPKMYEICFSLHLSMQDTIWFFQHVYYDRCFNCHTINEAVFYYCFKNNISYQDAQTIILEIEQQPDDKLTLSDEIINYTQFISNRIASFNKNEEFIQFMKENKSSFDTWNKAAYDTISEQLIELTGSDKVTSSDIDKLKRYLKSIINSDTERERLIEVDKSLFENCGLLLKEIQHDAHAEGQSSVTEAEYISETINNKSVLKNSFVLERLLNTASGIQKGKKVPYIVKVNFPSKKSLSDILGKNKIQNLESYDMIRKILVLFHFYIFWLHVKLGDTDTAGYDYEALFKIYKDEADSCLFDCGYEPLYAGNPYDWLFLCAANNEEPITFLRSCISQIIEEL